MSDVAVDTRISIRPARESDAPALCAAEREIARTPGRLVSLPEELVESNFAAKIREKAGTDTYLVAERDGIVVGHGFLETPSPQRRLAHVRYLNLVVHAPYAGQGIGTQLVARTAGGDEKERHRAHRTSRARDESGRDPVV